MDPLHPITPGAGRIRGRPPVDRLERITRDRDRPERDEERRRRQEIPQPPPREDEDGDGPRHVDVRV